MAEEEIIEPKVEEVQFPGSLVSDFNTLKSKLSQVPFYSFNQSEDQLDVVHVESRNVRKEPFLFYIVKFKKDGLTLTYSIIPGTSDRMRRANVLKNLSSILAMVDDDFKINTQRFFQYVDSVISDLLSGLNDNYSTLFNKYDSLLAEFSELRRLATELSNANRNLTLQAAQLSAENKNLQEQLKALQTYSDEALMAMIEDWLEVHDSTIDVEEFAKTYKVPEPRVEQILNKMVGLGYLELKG